MSSIAKRMLERQGWKEGSGLGKNGQGVKTYIKVNRRDPGVATGLGHAAEMGQTSSFEVELDAVYSSLASSERKAKTKMSKKDQECDVDDERGKTRQASVEVKGEKRTRGPSDDSSSATDDCASNCSSTSGSSSSDEGKEVDILRMSDKELLERCGGVRLGRAGRHRFFNGKLRRIEESHRGH
ncbi:G-patch domain containing protein, putative [Trypanosoma equiperdum]|uniref:G-patch domain-containing protein n=2 Tax=Trypanozoon TaxID=39700 RepID=Q57ZT0_TRYB2|nr:hypothetical protein, conserved [Trypanosoma brucei brucei TREU927]AAX79086.1 hypothetical protein, conserved [Trypanosoma brucei]AAZ11326.1 hypothetical protein, conserved [Trypanosoma brucei brucei TREU927]SCU70576.1 G-patch domain containing protein, putative [Trypanosoma equiperdum]